MAGRGSCGEGEGEEDGVCVFSGGGVCVLGAGEVSRREGIIIINKVIYNSKIPL